MEHAQSVMEDFSLVLHLVAVLASSAQHASKHTNTHITNLYYWMIFFPDNYERRRTFYQLYGDVYYNHNIPILQWLYIKFAIVFIIIKRKKCCGSGNTGKVHTEKVPRYDSNFF